MKAVRLDLRLMAASALALMAGLAVHLATRPEPTTEVLVAATVLPPGVPLAELEVDTRSLPPLPGLVEASRLDSVSQHSLLAALAPGEPLLESLLLPPGDRPDSVALTLDPSQAVQGDLLPGDRVDIYASGDEGTAQIAWDVLVLSVGASSGMAGEQVALVLAADPDLAAAIIAAAAGSRIDLVRRAR